MGPLEENSILELTLRPINPDGTYGDSFTWYGFHSVMDYPETATYTKSFSFLTETISGTLKLDLPRKMSRKKFKKWLMSKGFNRDLAKWFCCIVKSFHGKYSYQFLYFNGLFSSTPQGLVNILFDTLFPITNNKETEE